MKNIYKTMSALSLSLILSACGSSSDSSTGNISKVVNNSSAQLIDAPIVGAKYVNEDGTSGFTKKDGFFNYTGGKVKFYVGKIEIGSMDFLKSDNKVFLQDLLGVNRENKDDAKLLNAAQFLQSLDTDLSTDSIELASSYTVFESSKYENQKLVDIDTIGALNASGIDVKKIDDVKIHLNNSIKTYITNKQDYSNPSIVTISPNNNSVDVLANEDIIIEFTENISKKSLLNSNIELKDSNLNVIETKKTIKNNKLVISALKPLAAGMAYTLDVDKNLKDYAGNTLEQNRSITFTTLSANDTTAPRLISSLPTNNENNVPMSSSFILDFSEKLNDDSVTSSNIVLTNEKTNKIIKISLTHTSKKIFVKPLEMLEANNTYSLSLSSIEDKSSNVLSNQSLEFTTSNTFVFNNFTYKEIISPITGKKWLDRNIGAYKICEDKADEKCYGDYFQWGRKANGHEKKSSEVFDASLNPLDEDVLSNGKFGTWADDWRKNKNDDLWKGVNAINAICPSGYKVPSIDELLIETKHVNETLPGLKDQKITGQYENLKNFLKLPNNGFRKNRTRSGVLESRAYSGNIWSSSTNDVGLSYELDYFPGGIWASPVIRSHGNAVRCMRAYGLGAKPEVVATVPANGATDVSVNTQFRAQFSSEMLRSISRKNILLLKGDKQLGINFYDKISNRNIEFAVDHYQGSEFNLEYDSLYTLVFKKDLYDVSGNKMLEDKTITFTTEKKPEFQAPKIEKMYPFNKSKNAIRNENIRLSFSKDIKESTIAANVKLKNDTADVPFSYTYANKLLIINPTSNFDTDTLYTVEVLIGLSDKSDTAIFLKEKVSLTFTSGTEILPEDNAGNIYKEITSSKTNKVWLDRNLGAEKKCEYLKDKECYGTYFKARTTDFDAICPTNFRMPSSEELQDEFDGFTKTNLFENFLKVPLTGKKHPNDFLDSSNFTYIWSNTNGSAYDTFEALVAHTSKIITENVNKDFSLTIRCIKKD